MGRKVKYSCELEKLESQRKAKREYNARNREKIKSNNKKWYSDNKEKKQQYYLDNKKPLTKEEKNKKKEYLTIYRDENKEALLDYRLKNKENIAKNSKNWAQSNPDKVKKKTKEWRLNNPDKVKKTTNKYRKNKRETDPLFRLSCNVRSMLGKVIKRKGYSKTTRTHKILGCDFETFKIHIERQWDNWMNWDNYGLYNGEEGYGWDIDHNIPLSTAKTEDELLKLNNYKNLQPLCSKINRDIKIDKIEF